MANRITLFCSSFPPETGAAPNRMYNLASMLQKKGFAVEVICAMPNYPTGKIFKQYKGKLIVKEYVEDIPVTRIWLIPTYSSSKAKRIISLLSYTASLLTLGWLQLLKTKADLIILSSPPFITGYIGGIIAKTTKAKVVLNVSDLWPQTAFDLGFLKSGPLWNFLKWSEKAMYHNADAFSVQSKEIKKHIEIQEQGKEIFLYRNLQPFMDTATINRPLGKRKIVYAGLLGIAQGVYAIITAINFAELDTELHLYGEGFELNKILLFITKNPQRGVYYHGLFPGKEIPDILTRYHAMLIPLSATIMGAVPSKIFNAIANGLPILFSGNGEASTIISDTQTGLSSAAGDLQSLSKNISLMASMPEEQYNFMRQNCLNCNLSIFNKNNQDEDFINFLQQL